MIAMERSSRNLIGVILLASLMVMWGCQSTSSGPGGAGVVPMSDALAAGDGADLQRTSEVQLVEQMGRYRANYERYLELLKEFYEKQGNGLKAGWAQEEMDHLRLGPKRPYLVIAEIAGSDLKASSAILDADMLYNQGLQYMKEGRGTLGKLTVDKKKLYLATDKFNELITNYPSSDKIDDAAFQVGEIYNHYLVDYQTALVYYQRAWQWDAQTPLPARFAVAKIYDERFHNGTKALEYYQLVISLETQFPQNVEYAKNRIAVLSQEISR